MLSRAHTWWWPKGAPEAFIPSGVAQSWSTDTALA